MMFSSLPPGHTGRQVPWGPRAGSVTPRRWRWGPTLPKRHSAAGGAPFAILLAIRRPHPSLPFILGCGWRGARVWAASCPLPAPGCALTPCSQPRTGEGPPPDSSAGLLRDGPLVCPLHTQRWWKSSNWVDQAENLSKHPWLRCPEALCCCPAGGCMVVFSSGCSQSPPVPQQRAPGALSCRSRLCGSRPRLSQRFPFVVRGRVIPTSLPSAL